jgi:uncharacterized protein (TIGR02246 family)
MPKKRLSNVLRYLVDSLRKREGFSMSRRLKQIQFVVAMFLFFGAGVALTVRYCIFESAQAAEPAPASPLLAGPTSAGNPADEQAIRATAAEFVKAFNAGDAKTIGAEWSTDAQYTDESGQVFHGRAAIEKEYADLFKAQHGLTMALTIESLRFLGPDIAIEKGIAKVKSPADADTAARYTVVHARRDGKWVMIVGRDAPYVAVADGDYLKDLAWLIGEWSTGSKDQGLRIKFEWIAQRNFIKNSFMAVKDGQEKLTGAQVIGWNPKLGRIVSWHFDAQGGYGNDAWTKDGSKWVITATGVLRDGSESSAVNVLTPIDADSFTWQSVMRTLDGVSLPDAAPVKVMRMPATK